MNKINFKRYTKKDLKTKLKNVSLVMLGTIILAFGVAVFIIPFDLITGGVSGIAIILKKIIPVEFLTVDIYVTILTWLLFFIGLIVLGKNWAIKTLLCTIFYPIFLHLFLKFVNPNVLNGFFDLSSPMYESYKQIAILISALFGGAFIGAGVAITFQGGGSSGGVDVIALTLYKLFPKAKLSFFTFITDALIIVAGMFVSKNFVVSLMGITSAFVASIVVDKLFLNDKAFVAQVVSDKYEEINEAVINVLDRTTTIVHVTGGFSKDEKRMLYISFTMPQYTELLGLITAIDKNAFITINRAHEINGEGFTKPKPFSKNKQNNA